MPASIARQRITRRRIAGRPIGAAYGLVGLQAPFVYPRGAYPFTVPKSGYWKFVLWGAGAKGGGDAGCSGAYVEVTKALRAGQVVALVAAHSSSGSAGTEDTSATFPDGTVAIAGSAIFTPAAPGVASGGDVNLDGSVGGAAAGSTSGTAGLGTGGGAGGLTNGGAGAPGMLPFRGGDGGSTAGVDVFDQAETPGAGAGGSTQLGGQGQIIVFLVRE